jgi:plasmid stability protein
MAGRSRLKPQLRPVMVRLPEPLRRRLAYLAAQNERSMNAEIIFLLTQATMDREARYQKIAEARDRIAAEDLAAAAAPTRRYSDLSEGELQKVAGGVQEAILDELKRMNAKLGEMALAGAKEDKP